MPEKSHMKKKGFYKMCRDKAKEGLVNNAAGQWYRPPTSDRMGDMLLAGYRVGGKG